MMFARRPCPAKEPEVVMCDCPMHECVLEAFRAMAMPGGKKRALEAYRKECRIRQGQLGHGGQK